ncbi:hypothetical protein [Chryseobacterium sp. ERMR1:04]|uniref:hypothetical protein n=1 Tax=Chryseobacterium sp. ERMR1:04 TaxID=1705393 RepID=UPI0006C8D24A|nr:hypothetical protein [Chryseobacterium sp. ERMR1:04]KPH13717.1 hypothetical protein AMQ68_09235 [Chryseobacterium sp. ERMR1:04]
MNKNLLNLLKISIFSAVFMSCSGGSDNISENSNPNNGNSGNNSIALVSSKTQASIDTPFQFYFTGGSVIRLIILIGILEMVKLIMVMVLYQLFIIIIKLRALIL